jgi:glycosyltransferase involved in cell wall biosynthesis
MPQKKKKIVFHSNHSRAFTGFGKNCKNILSHLHQTGKYEIVEFCNGIRWGDPQLQKLPWRAVGSLPEDPDLIQQLNADPNLARQAGYGANMVDEIIKQEKPDIYVGAEDIWAFNGYTDRLWWNKTNCMIWTTLDSLPILPEAINSAPKIKNFYVWASFAEKALNSMGHNHVKTLHGSVDCSNFYRMDNEKRATLRQRFGIPQNSYIIGYVFRNQLRKTVPNLLDGFKLFLEQEPRSSAKLLLHTHWSEGWDIPRFLQEKGIDPQLVLTTYFCNKCGHFEVRPFSGQEQPCRACGAEKSLNTTNVTHGVSEEQLNQVYNLMDVYCHPFTSGGQELPIQEAKLTELITLATNYSCGEDSCSAESGGIPLEWSEYREPGTQFIKATTYPSSILKGLRKVFNMNPDKRLKQGHKSRQYVLDNYSVEKIGRRMEDIFDAMPEVEWDFNFEFVPRNPSYTPPDGLEDPSWVTDLYKNILRKDVDHTDDGHQHWIQRLKTDLDRPAVLDYFRSVANQENSKNQKIDFGDLFLKNDNKRALMVCNGDADSIFSATSLLQSFNESYPNTDLYFSSAPETQHILDGNPYITKFLPYNEKMENELLMVGTNEHKGYVDYYINLSSLRLKNLSSKNTLVQ